MEIVAVILAILFAVLSSGNRKKKGAANPTGGPVPKRTAAAGSRTAGVPAAVATAAEWVQAAGAAEVNFEASPVAMVEKTFAGAREAAEGAAMLEDEDCRGGSMPHIHAEGASALADEDCVGGSMAHDHAEGVSRADHARRLAAIDRESAMRDDGSLLADAVDARALRRAIVMAEVLGKPRSMRAR